jgi:Superfamily II DNA helicase
MKISITPKSSAIPLQLDIAGHMLELSDMASGSSISISDEGGRLTVRLVEAHEVHIPAAVEVKPEAVPAAEPAVQPETVRESVPVVRKSVVSEPEQLFHRLVALRKQISSEVRLPPYIIFHDVTLKEMCRLLPADLEAMKDVQGVGLAKLEKYGMRFVEAIRDFTAAGKAA